MPTYKNNTTSLQHFTLNGEWVENDFNPSEQRETDKYTDNVNLTLVSHTPYYNKVISHTEVTGLSESTASAQYVDIDLRTQQIIIHRISDNVSAYVQSVSNTPPAVEDATENDPIFVLTADGHLTKLGLVGAGSCTVTQYL